MRPHPDGRRGRYAREDGSPGRHGEAPRLRARAVGDGAPRGAGGVAPSRARLPRLPRVAAAAFRRLEVPSGELHVIVSFGPQVRVPAPVRSFVAAPHSEHTIVDFDAEQHGVEIRLTPIGARLLL